MWEWFDEQKRTHLIEVLNGRGSSNDLEALGAFTAASGHPVEAVELWQKAKKWGISGPEQDPASPREVLEELSNSPTDMTRRRVAENRATPPEVLQRLLKDKKADVRYAVLYNPSTPTECLIKAGSSSVVAARSAVASNYATPLEVLKRLSEDPKPDVRRHVAGNPCSFEFVDALTRDEDDSVRAAAAENPMVSAAALAALIEKAIALGEYGNVVSAAARNPNTPQSSLRSLQGWTQSSVRTSLAMNPNCPPDVLARLALDKHINVRSWVATNASTPPSSLALLAGDSEERVRRDVAENPSADERTRSIALAEVPTPAVASNAIDLRGEARASVSPVNSGLRLSVIGELYLGGGGFYVFASADDRSGESIGGELRWQGLGFDCTALVGSLHMGDICVGALVLPYGPWTAECQALVAAIGEVPIGASMDLPALLSYFPPVPLKLASLSVRDGIIICPFDDVEVALNDGEACEFGVSGELEVIAFCESDDWVDGPVLLVRSDRLSSAVPDSTRTS